MNTLHSLQDFLTIFSTFNIISISTRLFLALFIGGLIGIDREQATRSAGFRTYSLVCLGATLIMLIGNFIVLNFDGPTDISRLGAQVISGIGFLGAGAIMTSGHNKVHGLTTAAALWTCACIGLAIGVGFYAGAFITCFITLLLLRILRIVDNSYRKRMHYVDLYAELISSQHINHIMDDIINMNIQIINFESTTPKVSTNEIGIKLTLKIGKNHSSLKLLETLEKNDYVSFVHKVYI